MGWILQGTKGSRRTLSRGGGNRVSVHLPTGFTSPHGTVLHGSFGTEADQRREGVEMATNVDSGFLWLL